MKPSKILLATVAISFAWLNPCVAQIEVGSIVFLLKPATVTEEGHLPEVIDPGSYLKVTEDLGPHIRGELAHTLVKRSGVVPKNHVILSKADVEAYLSNELRRRPNDYDLLIAIANRQVLTEKKLLYLNKAIAVDPNNPTGYRIRANFQGASDASLRDLETAIRLAPEDYRLYLRRSYHFESLKRFDDALKDINRAIAIVPKAVDAYLSRIRFNEDAGHFDEAIADWHTIKQIDPNSTIDGRLADSHSKRGLKNRREGRIPDALADLETAITLAPDSSQHYSSRAQIYLKCTQDFHKAKSDLQKALQLKRAALEKPLPDVGIIGKRDVVATLTPSLNELAWLLATCPNDEVRDGREAVELAAEAVVLVRQNAKNDNEGKRLLATYLDTLAAAYAEVGDFKSAVNCQKVALTFATEESRTAFETRLKLFESDKPYRKTAKPEAATTTAAK